MPKGYIVAEVAVTDVAPYDEYRSQVLATVQEFGGRFLVRGGDPVLLEGDHPAARLVVLEFDSPEQATAWYNSEQYQKILPLRFKGALSRVISATGA